MHLSHGSWGVHPDPGKDTTARVVIRRAPIPDRLVIPLSQHIGVPCKPLVKAKQAVTQGELIGDADALITAPVHASAPGTVEEVGPQPHPGGTYLPSVVLIPSSDFAPGDWPDVRSLEESLALQPDQIRALVRAAGVVGMGGAGFPTHVKLSPPSKCVEICILNGTECEPLLTADHRIMLERSAAVVDGMRLIMHTLQAREGIIGIEDNKPDAAQSMAKAVGSAGLGQAVRVQVVHTRYPQGAEKTLVHSLTGLEVPSGGLPADVGVLVSNVSTAVAVRDGVLKNRPLTERIVTVSGRGVKTPANLLTLVGTPVRTLLEECAWMPEKTQRIVLGGPLMGVAIPDVGIPVTKTTTGILALTADDLRPAREYPCIRCGRCVQVCPMHLVPSTLATLCKSGRETAAKETGLLDCFECGSCAYGCPAKIPLVHWIRVGKSALRRCKVA